MRFNYINANGSLSMLLAIFNQSSTKRWHNKHSIVSFRNLCQQWIIRYVLYQSILMSITKEAKFQEYWFKKHWRPCSLSWLLSHNPLSSTDQETFSNIIHNYFAAFGASCVSNKVVAWFPINMLMTNDDESQSYLMTFYIDFHTTCFIDITFVHVKYTVNLYPM